MRKEYLFIALVAALLFVPACQKNISGQAVNPLQVKPLSCTDSDGGQNYVVKGRVYGNMSNNSYYEYWDACVSLVSVKEYYCSGRNPLNINYNCQNLGNYICTDGACVRNATNTCTDTDGGINATVWGQVYGQYNGQQYVNNDSCIANATVREWYCNGNLAASTNVNCQTGWNCVGGVCVQNQNTAPYIADITWSPPYDVVTFTAIAHDPQGDGTIQFVNFTYEQAGGHSYSYDYSYPYTITINTGYYQGIAYITAQAYDGQLWSAPYSEGVYINNTPPHNNSCAETDGGFNLPVFGFAYGYYGNVWYNVSDYCMSNVTLLERWCDGIQLMNTSTSCLINGTTHCQYGQCQ